MHSAHFRVRPKLSQRNTVWDDVDLFGRVAIAGLRLAFHHFGVGDDPTGTAAEKRFLKFEALAVLGIEADEKAPRERGSSGAMLQPGLVNSIAGPIDVALPNTVQAKEQIDLVFRFGSLDLIGKSQRRVAAETGHRSPWPFAGGPGGVGKEPDWMARFAQTAAKALQIRFGSPGFRMSAADEANG